MDGVVMDVAQWSAGESLRVAPARAQRDQRNF
jgi:hypothetical protein